MRLTAISVCLLPILTSAVRIVLSNDDGWAEINIRAFYNALKSAGNSVVVSAPAENKSGTGSADVPPTSRTSPCEFNSCPSGSPATGNNASDLDLNYVDSFPVTAIKYGINTLAPKLLGGPPDVAVAGPNVGANTGLTTQVSGTVGAATAASKAGIPGIAFSGTTGTQTAWTAPQEPYVGIYADLSTNVTSALLASGKPYLPTNIWLNVNYPTVGGSCTQVKEFKFVLSRIDGAVPFVTGDDVETCGSKRLPKEADVVKKAGCFASISVGKADTKLDAGKDAQAVVLAKLRPILSCLAS